jgi:DNA-binding LacI/PurR family transcriptional regulator
VLVNRLLNQFFAEYLSAVESKLSALTGYHVVPFETLSRADRAEELLGMIDQRLCDAIIALEYTGDPEKSASTVARPSRSSSASRSSAPRRSVGRPGVFVDYEPASAEPLRGVREAGARRSVC